MISLGAESELWAPYLAAPKDSQATFVFLGDLALGRSVEALLARYGSTYSWQALQPLLETADLTVANLEGVLTTRGRPLQKAYLIRAHPEVGSMLASAGVDLVSLANNHALDYGQEGLDETLDTLDVLGLKAVGAGPAEDPAQAHQPVIWTLGGVRVAVLGYLAERWNGSVDVPATEHLAWARPEAVQADVRAIRGEVDVVVVLLHAGTEYAATPSADQTTVARAAVEAGAHLVVGHHPHVTQTVERYMDALIVYSLGDAVFDIPYAPAMEGQLLRVHVARDGVTGAELWPFWIEKMVRPRLLDDGTGAPVLEVVHP
jgi:poly-gamma-glutamate synthesis protein (capsule biosynthesis protein)